MSFQQNAVAAQGYTATSGEEKKPIGLVDKLFVALTWFLIAICPPCWFCVFNTVQDYERAVIFQLGRVREDSMEKRGLFPLNHIVSKIEKVDIRTKVFDIPQQEIISKDAVTIRVDAVVHYKVVDPLKAVNVVQNFNNTTRLLAQTTLRNILGLKTMTQILQEREEISHALQQSLDLATDAWGIKVERVEVKDIILPATMRRAMAAEAEAQREAKAKCIQATGEKEAAINIADAARLMASNPQSLQLRYLQTLHTISAQKNSTIVFPLPTEMMK